MKAKEAAYNSLMYKCISYMAGRYLTDEDDFREVVDLINATLFTIYMMQKGIDGESDKEQKLYAQSFSNQILRGLFDFIDTDVEMALANEDFDDEFLPEVDDGK